jgi:hypothetical protein
MFDRHGSFQLTPQALQGAPFGAPSPQLPFAAQYGQGQSFTPQAPYQGVGVGYPLPSQPWPGQQQPYGFQLPYGQPHVGPGFHAAGPQIPQAQILQTVIPQVVAQVIQALIPQIQAQVMQQLAVLGIGSGGFAPFSSQQSYAPTGPMLQGAPLGADTSTLRNQPVLWS